MFNLWRYNRIKKHIWFSILKYESCHIDGGNEYLRFGGNDFSKILIIFDDGTEILASDEERYKKKYEEWENNRIREFTKNENINN